MELSYWESRWQKGNTGWHMQQVYPLLPKLWPHLSLDKNSHVLVPLCGKSLDLYWIQDQGHTVTGVEVSSKAVQAIKNQDPQSFIVDASHGFTVHRTDDLTIWEGDFLKLPERKIETPDLIYDKAAIVALPPEMRISYAQKILAICDSRTKILLQTFEYNQDEMNGPPFSVDEKELLSYYGQYFSFKLLHEQSKFEELEKFQQRGLSSYLNEKVFLLEPR